MDKPRVIVADDEPSIRSLVCRYLTIRGAEAIPAADAFEAEVIFLSQYITAVVIDRNMPRRSGLEFLRRMQGKLAGVATVLMTAHATDQTREEAKELGAVAYLVKPFALSDLERALQTALQSALHETESQAAVHRIDAISVMLREIRQRSGAV